MGFVMGGLDAEDYDRHYSDRELLRRIGGYFKPAAGAMALVEYSAEEVARIIADHPEFSSIEPAVYAAPTHTTVGGRAKPVADFVAWVEEQGKFARQLQVRGAGHTSDVDMLLGELAAEIAGLEPHGAHERLEQRGLPGAVHAHQPGDLPVGDLQVHAIQGAHAAVVDDDAARPDRGRHRALPDRPLAMVSASWRNRSR